MSFEAANSSSTRNQAIAGPTSTSLTHSSVVLYSSLSMSSSDSSVCCQPHTRQAHRLVVQSPQLLEPLCEDLHGQQRVDLSVSGATTRHLELRVADLHLLSVVAIHQRELDWLHVSIYLTTVIT